MCWVLPDFGYGFTLDFSQKLMLINALASAGALSP
jgi:hypothetical protein